MNPFRNLIAHVKVLQSVKVKSNYILNLLIVIICILIVFIFHMPPAITLIPIAFNVSY